MWVSECGWLGGGVALHSRVCQLRRAQLQDPVHDTIHRAAICQRLNDRFEGPGWSGCRGAAGGEGGELRHTNIAQIAKISAAESVSTFLLCFTWSSLIMTPSAVMCIIVIIYYLFYLPCRALGDK